MRAAEERQDQNAKRRKIEKDMASKNGSTGPAASLNLTAPPVTASSLPSRPDFAAKADSIGLGGPKNAETALYAPTAAMALAGSNRDVVANRAAIRLANMSAAEILKAEMASLVPVKKTSRAASMATATTAATPPVSSTSPPAAQPPSGPIAPPVTSADIDIPGLGGLPSVASSTISETSMSVDVPAAAEPAVGDAVSPAGNGAPAGAEDDSVMSEPDGSGPHGVKRSIEEVETEDAADPDSLDDEEETAPEGDKTLALKVNPDGTVEQEDFVKCVRCAISARSGVRSIVDQCVIGYGSPDTGNGTIVKSSVLSTPMLSSGSSECAACGSRRCASLTAR